MLDGGRNAPINLPPLIFLLWLLCLSSHSIVVSWNVTTIVLRNSHRTIYPSRTMSWTSHALLHSALQPTHFLIMQRYIYGFVPPRQPDFPGHICDWAGRGRFHDIGSIRGGSGRTSWLICFVRGEGGGADF